MEACEVRGKRDPYGEHLLCLMVTQNLAFPAFYGVFLRFGYLVKNLMEIVGLQQFTLLIQS